MSQTAPPSDKTKKRDSSLSPPDERFWQRYSPHAELPLSSAGSLVFHLLVLGTLGLLAWLGISLLGNAHKSLPVEAVRIGGGGGNPRGQGDGPNTGAPVETGGQPDKGQTQDIPNEDVPKNIDVKPAPTINPKFNNPSDRRIQSSEAANTFARLREGARRVPSADSNPPGRGQGGPGTGGGQGTGEGPGTGPGKGQEPGNLTQREKRQLRWSMLFNTRDSADYVAQLQALGAILAVPVQERGDDFEYKIVRNLSPRSAKMLNEDIQQVQQEVQGMVRWFDNDPKNVMGVLNVLGLPAPNIPRDKLHFVACMPEKLEKKLLSLELSYLKRKHAGRTEDDIRETKFEIKIRNGKYEPEVKSQALN